MIGYIANYIVLLQLPLLVRTSQRAVQTFAGVMSATKIRIAGKQFVLSILSYVRAN